MAHTVQQEGTGVSQVQNTLQLISPYDASEREADTAAQDVLYGQRAKVTIVKAAHIARRIPLPEGLEGDDLKAAVEAREEIWRREAREKCYRLRKQAHIWRSWAAMR